MRGRSRHRSVPKGIRITRLGLGYVLLALVVAVAATNTGNNALFMVLAMMLAILVISGIASRQNVRGLDVQVEPPAEIFANRSFPAGLIVVSRNRWWPHWFLRVDLPDGRQPRLIPYLPTPGHSRGQLELLLQRRGLHRLRSVEVSSLFPFGLFRKGESYPLDLELLVYPELFDSQPPDAAEVEGLEEQNSLRAGRGQGLHQLRLFRPGDDPRSVHWKQTAKTGQMIFMERDSERGQRLSILLDNGLLHQGKLDKKGQLPQPLQQRFERLVSEAATVAVEHLARGFEIELVTRQQQIGFGRGARQRLAILEALALIAPCQPDRRPLEPSLRGVPQLRLSLDVGREAA